MDKMNDSGRKPEIPESVCECVVDIRYYSMIKFFPPDLVRPSMKIIGKRRWAVLPNTDQVGHARPADGLGDIGAIEMENGTLD